MIPDQVQVQIAGGLEITMPRMVNVRQKFEAARLHDIGGVIAREFQRPEIRSRVLAGQSIAVGCGSRGIANIAEIVKSVILELKALGAQPFIFPCMGSHGAATAEGQKKVLGSSYFIAAITAAVYSLVFSLPRKSRVRVSGARNA